MEDKKSIHCTLTDHELAAKADQLIDELIKSGGKSFTMHVPARPNADPDLIFAELNNRFKKLITAAQPGAVWVKASERPQNSNLVHLQYSTGHTNFKLTGYYEPSEGKWHRQDGKLLDWAPNLEWLDESTAAGRGEDAVEFGRWLKHLDNGTTHYNPFTKEETESIGFSPADCFIDDTMTVEELYVKFKQKEK